MLKRIIFPIATVLLGTGCTVLTSETPEQVLEAGRDPEGVHYSLPKGVVEATLKVAPDTGTFRLDIGEPQFVPDPSHNYYLRYRPLPNYHDIAKVTVNDKGFVKQIDVDTTDKTGEIIVNLAKALSAGGAFEAGEEAAATPDERLLTLTFDPTGPEAQEVQKVFNAEITAYVNRRVDVCNELLAGGKEKLSFGMRQIKAAEAIDKQKIVLNSYSTAIGRLTAAKDRYLKDPSASSALQVVDVIPLPQYKEKHDICKEPTDKQEKADSEREKTDSKQEKTDSEEAARATAERSKLKVLFSCYCQALKQDADPQPFTENEKHERKPKARTYSCEPPTPSEVSEPKVAMRAIRSSEDVMQKLTELLSPPEKKGPEQARTDEQRFEFLNLLLAAWQEKEAAEKKELDGLNSQSDAHKQQSKICGQYAKMDSKGNAPRIVLEVHDYSEASHEALPSSASYQVASADWAPKVETTQPSDFIADCTTGVCYRPKEPYRIDYYIEADGIHQGAATRIMELPNNAPLASIDIRRAFLVQKLTTIDFNDDGFLLKVRVKKPSELLALSSLPLQVTEAILDGFKIRAETLTEKRNAAAKEVELLKAKQALAQTQAPATQGTPLESAVQRAVARPPRRGVTNFPSSTETLPEESQ